MKTVDIQYYEGSRTGFSFEGRKFANMRTGEVVTGVLGGIWPKGISSKSILFETSKGQLKDMQVKNFIKRYQLLIEE